MRMERGSPRSSASTTEIKKVISPKNYKPRCDAHFVTIRSIRATNQDLQGVRQRHHHTLFARVLGEAAEESE